VDYVFMSGSNKGGFVKKAMWILPSQATNTDDLPPLMGLFCGPDVGTQEGDD
jgi:hypothetical protein